MGCHLDTGIEVRGLRLDARLRCSPLSDVRGNASERRWEASTCGAAGPASFTAGDG
jgi:hypothetical protein